MKEKSTKGKRGNGEGCIRQLKSGYWEARTMIGRNENGKPKFKTFTNKKRSVVVKRLEEYNVNIRALEPEKICTYTVAQWLDRWYKTYVINNVKTSTRSSYEENIRYHLKPYIGHIKLVELKKSHIENLYRNLLENGRVKTKGGLHVKTVTNIANMLHESLQEAMRDEYIIKNPAALARVPTMRSENCAKSKIEVLTAEERKILEDNCGNDIYGTAIYMLLNTGVRIGELLGIQWRDIDFNKGAVSINKQVNRIKNYDSAIAAKTRLLIQHSTKTNKSTRIIPLHEELLKRLSIYKKIQDEQKILWGDMYNDSDMVFCNECGNLIDPSTIRSHFHKKLAALGVNKIKLHALRHTFATEALEAGVPLKAVSKILGHSSSQITADTYSHVSLELQQEAMSQIQRYKDSRNSL